MRRWLAERVEEVRARLTPEDEGALWMLLLDEPYGEPVVACALQGAMRHVDEQLVANLALILEEVPAKAVLLAVPRPAAQPLSADLELWFGLRRLVGSGLAIELVDLVVVGDRTYWSAREAGHCAAGDGPWPGSVAEG